MVEGHVEEFLVKCGEYLSAGDWVFLAWFEYEISVCTDGDGEEGGAFGCVVSRQFSMSSFLTFNGVIGSSHLWYLG